METKIEKLNSEIAQYNNIEEFQMWLNKPIEQKNIKEDENISLKIGEHWQKMKYLPIATIEQQLDNIFAGLWSVENLNYELIGNSLTVSLDLKVFHPIAQIWITRSGVGAIPVQLKKGQKIMSFETVQFDAIKKGLPSAKSTALKNAAQSLGTFFGRNLNREEKTEYKNFSKQVIERSTKQEIAYNLLMNSDIKEPEYSMLESRIEKSFNLDKAIQYLKSKNTTNGK